MSIRSHSSRRRIEAPVLDIPTARAFLPLLEPARYKGAEGGRASAKSHFFGGLLIEEGYRRPIRAVGIREVQNSIEQSVKQLLEDKIKAFGLEGFYTVRDTWIEARNGTLIVFKGMQNHTAEAVKSLEAIDIAWVEEAQSLSQRSLDVLRPTIRKPGSELWFSWNPRSPKDPVDRFFNQERPANSRHVKVTFRDNPWISAEMLAEMEHDRSRDPDRYAHVWLGKYKALSSARVFRNWRIGKPDEFKPLGQTWLLGADFGFSQDPTVLIGCYYIGRTLYVFAEAYAVGCEIDHTPFLFAGSEDERIINLNRQAFESLDFERKRTWRGIPNAWKWTITADSARPETISYLKKHGFDRIQASKKGAGSVEEGVEFLKTFDIVVHPDCVHTIDELTEYSFKIDPLTEKVLPILSDKKNHVIDALRYAAEDTRRAKAGMW